MRVGDVRNEGPDLSYETVILSEGCALGMRGTKDPDEATWRMRAQFLFCFFHGILRRTSRPPSAQDDGTKKDETVILLRPLNRRE